MKQVMELGNGFAFYRQVAVLEGLVYGPSIEGLIMDRTTNNEKVELTMENKTTVKQQAEAILENIKAGTTTTVETVKGFDIKGAITKAWDTVKGYDYTGTMQGALNKVSSFFGAVGTWFTDTKTGRATSYVLGATATMAAVGLLFNPITTVIGGAAIYTGIKAFNGKKEDLTVINLVKDFAINTLLFAAMATVAYFVVPFIYVALTYLYYAGVYALLIPSAVILF